MQNSQFNSTSAVLLFWIVYPTSDQGDLYLLPMWYQTAISFSLTALSEAKHKLNTLFSPHITIWNNCNRKLLNCLIICTISYFLYPLELSSTLCLSSCFRNIRSISGKWGCGLSFDSSWFVVSCKFTGDFSNQTEWRAMPSLLLLCTECKRHCQ